MPPIDGKEVLIQTKEYLKSANDDDDDDETLEKIDPIIIRLPWQMTVQETKREGINVLDHK